LYEGTFEHGIPENGEESVAQFLVRFIDITSFAAF
jgi:hypothetical protein